MVRNVLSSLFWGVLCVFTVAAPFRVDAQDSTDKPIETRADQLDFNGETKRIVASGNVIVTYGDTRLTADKVSVDNVTKDVYAEGDVHIYREGTSEWHVADQVQYNVKTGALNSGPARAFSDDYYLSAGSVESQSREHYILRNSEFTTSEYHQPTWRWKCGSVVYYPDEKIVFRNAVLYAGDVPVFYFPYFYYDLDDITIGASLTVGSKSDWGPYVLAKYKIREDKYLWPVVKLDYRKRRGLAGGVDLEYGLGYDAKGRPGADGHGRLETYYADDRKVAGTALEEVPRPDGPGTYLAKVRPERYRLKLLQKYNPFEDIETTIKADKISDAAFLQDFFQEELQRDQQPDSFAEIQKYNKNWTLNLLYRPQINNFYTTTKREPDLSLNIPRQSIGGGFYYESENSAAILQKKNFDSSLNQDFNSVRVDTFHQITYPLKWFDWLNVVPRAGARATYYSHSRLGGAPNDASLVRGIYNTGVEFSTKLHQTWKGVRNEALQIDGLRHLIEPSVNYAFVAKPNHLPRDILQFDPGVPSGVQTQLRPIDFPQDVGIDNINRRNIFRPMIRNRWQTQRDGQPYNFLDVIIYQDLKIDPPDGKALSNLFWSVEFQPTTWLRLSYASQYNYYEAAIEESYVSVAYQYFKDWEIGFSHSFLKGVDGNEVWPYFKWRLNEDWAFRTEQRINTGNGRLRESLFSIDRDFSAWVVSMSLRNLNPTVEPDDLQVWLVWTLKAFPEASAQISQ